MVPAALLRHWWCGARIEQPAYWDTQGQDGQRPSAGERRSGTHEAAFGFTRQAKPRALTSARAQARQKASAGRGPGRAATGEDRDHALAVLDKASERSR